MVAPKWQYQEVIVAGATSMPRKAIDDLIEITVATCESLNTRKMYGIYLRLFLASGLPLNRDGVSLHIKNLREAGKSATTTCVVKAALKKLAKEAEIRHLITFDEYSQIASVSGGKIQRSRSGLWLTASQVEQLLALPDRTTYAGQREACILSLMVGCGLRKEEMATITWDHYQEREGRMCLVDFRGKGNKPRTVPVPIWAQADADVWQITSQTPEFVPGSLEQKWWQGCWKNHPYDPQRISGRIGYSSLGDLVERYGKLMGVPALNPHDLRRTLAKLLHKSGASIEQIQYTLGHQHIHTTTIYLGSAIELCPGEAAIDKLTIRKGKGGKV